MIEQATIHLPYADKDSNLPVSIYLGHYLASQKVTECRPAASGGSGLELHIHALSTSSTVPFFPKRTFACPVKLAWQVSHISTEIVSVQWHILKLVPRTS